MQGRLVGVEAATVRIDAPQLPATLFRLLASGRAWAIADLAAALVGDEGGDARAVVSGALQTLRAAGMPLRIDAAHVQGDPFVPLDDEALGRSLAVAMPRCRWNARAVFATGSTNADLMRDVRAGRPSRRPLLLAAEVQHAGRGRLGRSWSSQPGGSITASFALPIARSLANLDGVTLACGLAVGRVLTLYGVAPRLKWPNDVLLDGRKLAGILVEAHANADITILVIGVGLNVGASPSPAVATMQAVGAAPLDRNRLVAELAAALQTDIATFERDGFAAFAARWNAADAFRDRTVTVGSSGGPALTGIARGVDDRGALLVDVDGVLTTMVAGEVSLRLSERMQGQAAA